MKQLIVPVLCLLAFMTGCAPQVHYRTQQFRIVDGVTHLPLEGVNTHRVYINVVRFDKEGYQPGDVNIGPDFGLKNSRWDHAVLSSPITEAKIQTGKRVPLEQTITIPLFRQNRVPTSRGQ